VNEPEPATALDWLALIAVGLLGWYGIFDKLGLL
jgi:hypothetical protein